ncbi:plakophilin-3a [Hoplias malabaricus]|uniref:plakophilin-3a n=1 Tax=Hoplias malabaricus TaxID=27720 RepID=UPI0034629361
MSTASEGLFYSALQPNSTVSTYAVPPESHLSHGSVSTDAAARAKRVQAQVALRLAEKSNTITRQNGATQQYASSEYGGSSTMTKYQTYNPGFSSKSYMYNASRPMTAQRMSTHSSSGYSSRSAVDFGPRAQMSRGNSGGMMYSHDDSTRMTMGGGGYQGGQSHRQQYATVTRTMSRPPGPDPETMSLRSLRMQSLPPQQQQQVAMATWMTQDGGGSEGSLVSDNEANYSHQDTTYAMSNGYASTYPRQTLYSTTSNGFSSVGGAVPNSMTLPIMSRSLSGTLARSGGGGGAMDEETYVRQSFKGPSQRTISRITQRQGRYSMSTGSVQGGGGGGGGGGGFVIGGSTMDRNLSMMQQGRLSRAASMRSVLSVGKGKDVFDGMDMAGSMGNLSGINALDMPTAVSYLDSPEVGVQVLGAAYIQHECYHSTDAKKLVNQLKGIKPLVQLFSSENDEVKRYATGAARNVIYEDMANKLALIEAGGIPLLTEALRDTDEELRKNITGILWNLSSKDNLKEKLAKEILPRLTEDVLIPLSGTGDKEILAFNSSESDIFFNTTGCLRNLSSINDRTREKMRETPGLVDALVGYIEKSLEENNADDKGVENCMCVLRNLSFQLYNEIPPSVSMRLDGPTRAQASSRGEPIGCFTPQSRKAKDRQDKDLHTFSEVSRAPKGMEWLWHPQILGLYNRVLQRCELNPNTREAAAGALQNITAGDKRWASILSRIALEQERMLPVVLDRLRTTNDSELKSITGFLRNLSRHAKDKNDMATKVVNNLVEKLPVDGLQKEPGPESVINICGALNNLVICSELAARDITYFDGLTKLVGIKNSHNNDPWKVKASKAAATVLCNMFQYKKLHKEYKKKGYQKEEFTDTVI